ncbi:MAG: permease [Planctomycetota bacterium]|nr:permease [Planctomycetota bacterium]
METAIAGGVIRGIQGVASASATILIGLFIATVLRFYLGPLGTKRLFGGETVRSLPQSWLIGMLLPVCSIGVIPMLIEMKRIGVRRGAITAFALAAPLFNPLSILYGLTLSRPVIIIGFAAASLLVVTVIGIIWDSITKSNGIEEPVVEDESKVIGMRRIFACVVFAARELAGPTGAYAFIAILGLVFLGSVLPHGALQTSVEQGDIWAPLKMAIIAIFIYAPPMLTMSQLGMMFDHGNSPGASFCLLLLGTGINLGTIVWTARNYGIRQTLVWLVSLTAIVIALAYGINKPLIPVGIKPAGHTHAFDIYTNPLIQGTAISASQFYDLSIRDLSIVDKFGLVALAIMLCFGVASRTLFFGTIERLLAAPANKEDHIGSHGFQMIVPKQVVGLTGLIGLVVLSVVGCFAYYPKPSEVLEEMKIARVEVLSNALSGNYEAALRWIPVLEEWSRRLEVGSAIRRRELRPYQQAQTHLLRTKLELLEHLLEHELDDRQAKSNDHNHKPHSDSDEVKTMIPSISLTSENIVKAYE